ncbi:MAG TPA: hypothetical protein VMT75_01155 [Candidatus Saccharimonadales bacterium]|nr:hypothetical protein [Candidatus Saccharimonadales bacterium]
MTLAPDPDSTPRFKRTTLIAFVVLAVAAAYALFVIVSRFESDRAFERRAAQQAAARRLADDRAAVEQLGGSELAIRSLYLSPSTIHPGQSAQLCYDVTNAKTVTLDPPSGEVWPSHNRCIDVSPKKTTTYTLTISGTSGSPVSNSVLLTVK